MHAGVSMIAHQGDDVKDEEEIEGTLQYKLSVLAAIRSFDGNLIERMVCSRMVRSIA
jgi:hypothetical protein